MPAITTFINQYTSAFNNSEIEKILKLQTTDAQTVFTRAALTELFEAVDKIKLEFNEITQLPAPAQNKLAFSAILIQTKQIADKTIVEKSRVNCILQKKNETESLLESLKTIELLD